MIPSFARMRNRFENDSVQGNAKTFFLNKPGIDGRMMVNG